MRVRGAFGIYNRILRSPVLAGEKTVDDIMLNGAQWYRDHGISLYKGNKVTGIDPVRRRVIAADGTTVGYCASSAERTMQPRHGHRDDIESISIM
jgi:NAD(P)H-nitrite reductase large subunit